MKKLMGVGCVAIFLSAWAAGVQATPCTIFDNYIGADPKHNSPHVDVIGGPAVFDISRMDVDFNGSELIVEVYTGYVDHVGTPGTQSGDLFIRTDGWKPFGTAPCPDDMWSVGTKWTHMLVLDNHLKESGGELSAYIQLVMAT